MSSQFELPKELSDYKNVLEKTDSDGILSIYSYSNCNNNSSDEIKKLRGLIYTEDGKKVFGSLGYTQEYNENEDWSRELENTSLNSFTFFPSEEGTVIRLFHYEKWYVSTHRRLEAHKSRWGSSETFGTIFDRSLTHSIGESRAKDFTNELDKEYMYLFFIRNTEENRIVSNAPETPTVFCVGKISKSGDFSNFEGLGLQQQEKLNFSNMSEVVDYVKNIDPFVRQGVIAFRSDGSQFKVVNSTYQLYTQVRGNEPSVKFRYLSVRNNPVYLSLIHKLYPKHTNDFIMYEFAFLKVAKKIHNTYIQRFINKEYVVTDPISYRIIREAHGRHIANRNFKVTLVVIMSILSEEQFLSTLNRLIKIELNVKN